MLSHFAWGTRTLIMGVINVTPDSFSGDSIYGQPEAVAALARRFVDDGADILDIGGESTRPGHEPVSAEEEQRRVLPAIAALREQVDVPVAVDTSKAVVAAAAIVAGATLVNDVSGLRDPRLAAVCAGSGAGLVIVHRGWAVGAEDPVRAVLDQLRARIERAEVAGVDRMKILVDPGLGIGKGWRENFAVLRRLSEVKELGKPLLVGPSRKGMIGKALGVEVSDRMEGTAALVMLSIAGGADVVRVHDVREMARVARMTDALVRQGG